ncbi:MAG: arginine--tRNA ligase [Lentisphaerae bacterium]|jgi:arginyl-tRNA synthetase|nr:arginine--tRNA ligase [Lentisphaerota bacterium]
MKTPSNLEESGNRCETALAVWLVEAFSKAFGSEADGITLRVQAAADDRFGDFQCNDAMPLARSLKKSPRAIAEAVLAALPAPSYVEKAEIAGPGFINITVKAEWLAAELAAMAAKPLCGIPQSGAGETIILDYSSPNIAKPMHIGHIRSTVIGNALDRMYRALGYKVIADNHLGDWGTQFGVIIMGYRNFLDQAALAADPISELERVYVASYERAREDEAWMDQCRAELVKLQQGDPENRALWESFVELSLGEFERVYRRLGVNFDLHRGESFYNEMLADTVALLEREGLAEESEGALVVRLEDEGLPVCIVRKSDGGYNYATTDIATVRSRVAEFAPGRVIYVTDERQQLHFRQFFTVCAKLGITTQLKHVWFGLMRLPEGTFSTRQGNVIKLEALLDEAVQRARAIIDESDSSMSEVEKSELAAQIGIGAVKYADLSHDPQNMIVFTWDKALALDGNSGPYLQYAHARICSLLDKYSEMVPECEPRSLTMLVEGALERALVLQLLRFPTTVQRAAEACKPSIMADYLFTLCQAYSSFYQQSPVLKADPAVRDSRIALCAYVADILRQGLELLGMAAPPRI